MSKSPAAEAGPSGRRHLVNAIAEQMRTLVLAHEPDTQIGSLRELAQQFGVGIVTVQQAARVLEHEGLLEVRRGPGGGYYGTRPDAAALERAIATYLRVRGSSDYEALEMMTLLDTELLPAAAQSTDDALHDALRQHAGSIDRCTTGDERIAFEDELHRLLFQMVRRPLIEMLAQVSMRYYRSHPIPQIFDGDAGIAAWRQWRHDVVDAILARDPELTRFQAYRHRRRLLARLGVER